MVIIRKDGSLCASFLDNKVHKICTITPDDNHGKIIDATFVTLLSTANIEKVERKILMSEKFVAMWGLALQIKLDNKSSDNSENYFYYIITDTWKERWLNQQKKHPIYSLK